MTAEAAGVAPRGPLTFITLTVLIDAMGFGLIVPVLPALVSELGGMPMNEAATMGGFLIMSYALAQFLFSPVIGGLSDAFGRRPVLLLSMAGFALSSLGAAAASTLAMLFVARILAGVTGASYTTAYAYIADVTPPARRAQAFGLVGVAFGMGFIVGPALGGFLGAGGSRLPFLAAAGMAGLNLLLGLLVLPESLPRHLRRSFDWRRANPVGSLRRLSTLGGALKRFAITYFLWMLAIQSLHGVWSYIVAYRYGWSPFDIGLSLTLVGVLAVLVNGLLVKRAVDMLGEWRTAVAGIMAGTIGYVVHIFAHVPALAYAGIIVGGLGGLTIPALQALMTERASATDQGELQGGLATLASITVVAGPLIFSQLFAAFSGAEARLHAPGAPFVLAALLSAAALALMLAAERPGKG
ncbi:MFS transporter [Sandaracinobacteroides sp. A072]|uniref:MFS transporter n=1 Tax=Sandaracinobacteroides sp. A072 TaxID=3461146 RepID=UPI0040416DE3